MNILEALNKAVQTYNPDLYKIMLKSLEKWSLFFAEHNKESLEKILEFFIINITYVSKSHGVRSIVCTANNPLIKQFFNGKTIEKSKDKNNVVAYNILTKKPEKISLKQWDYGKFFFEFSPAIEYTEEELEYIKKTLNNIVNSKTVKF